MTPLLEIEDIHRLNERVAYGTLRITLHEPNSPSGGHVISARVRVVMPVDGPTDAVHQALLDQTKIQLRRALSFCDKGPVQQLLQTPSPPEPTKNA